MPAMRVHGPWVLLGLMSCTSACTRETQPSSLEPVTASPAVPPDRPTPSPVEPPPSQVPSLPAPAPSPWVDASIRGQAEWVGFRDDERVWIATAELGSPAGLAEHDVATGARKELVITDRPEAGPPAALSRAAGLLAFADHEGVILHPLDGAGEERIVTTRPDELAFSPAGDRLAMTWSEAGSFARVEVFAVADRAQLLRAFPFGKQRLEYDSGPHVSVTFVDGDRLALLLANDTPSWATLARGAVPGRKWKLQPLLDTEERWGMAASLGRALAASPDGAWLAAGNFETRALLLPATAASEPVALVGAEAVVTALAFAPDGRWVAAAGEDGPLRLHAVPSGELLARAEAPQKCGSLAVSPSGKWIAGGCDGALRIWDVEVILEQGTGAGAKP
jgi:hypothetical protein